MNVHPSYVTESMFDFPVKINHSNTGHIYIRPKNNLKPFSAEQEEKIVLTLAKIGIGCIRNRVTSNFQEVRTEIGFGYRIYQNY